MRQPNVHPEAFCERCHRPNVTWFAPSDLWNKAVRAVGAEEILCPVCFVQLAEAAGIKPTAWVVSPEVLDVNRLEEQNIALETRVSQFQFCINRIAEALGNVCCGGVDSSPENQLADPHSTTRVLCDAIKALQRTIALRGAALEVWKSGKANKPGIAF